MLNTKLWSGHEILIFLSCSLKILKDVYFFHFVPSRYYLVPSRYYSIYLFFILFPQDIILFSQDNIFYPQDIIGYMYFFILFPQDIILYNQDIIGYIYFLSCALKILYDIFILYLVPSRYYMINLFFILFHQYII